MSRLTRKSRWLFAEMAVVGLAGLGVLLTFALRIYDFPVEASRLDQVVDEAESLGIPLTAEDLRTGPIPDPEDNAAPLLIRAAQILTDSTSELNESERRALGSKFFKLAQEGKFAEAQGGLGRHKAATDLFKTAASKSGCDFAFDFDLGAALKFPQAGPLGALSDMLLTESLLKAKSGDLDSALKSLHASLTVARHLGATPQFSLSFTSFRMSSRALATAEELIALNKDQPDELRKIREFLQRHDVSLDFKLYLKHEAYSGIAALRNLHLNADNEDAPPEELAKHLQRSGMPPQTKLRGVMAAYIGTWCRAFNRIEAEHADAVDAARILEEEVDRLADGSGLADGVALIQFPVFTSIGSSLMQPETKRRCLILLCEVLEDPAGRDVVASSTSDPFLPSVRLRVKRSNKEIRVYSVGANRVDDGGTTAMEARRRGDEKASDVVVSIPRSEAD